MYEQENPAFYSEVDLSDIIHRKQSAYATSDRLPVDHHHHHHNPLHHHNRLRYDQSLPPPFRTADRSLHHSQRLRNEIIVSAAALPSLVNGRKRPIGAGAGFWEIPIRDAAESRTKNRRTMMCLSLLVVCLVVVVVTVSALSYWKISKNLNNDWDSESYAGHERLPNSAQVEDERASKTIFGEFTITNRVFSDALALWSGAEFDTLASDVIKSMDEIFLESPLARVYNATQISAFSKSETNEVIAKCVITLRIALLTAAQEVGLTFIQALERGHGRLPSGKLRVDIRTIKFTALSSSATVPPIGAQTGSRSRSRSDARSPSSPPVKESESKKELLNVKWSNWSEWSPCRGANSKCDAGRIHSRIRKCLSESGDVVNSDICRLANGEQQELEIRDCRCDEESPSPPTPAVVRRTNSSAPVSVAVVGDHHEVSQSANVEQSERACSDCGENEICLLQVKAAVPFCAKIKDPRDPRGCGGWCSGRKELCRYVGTNTYQCVDDSECLEGEWQCANGLCIPHERRCDGHFNCFDMSDETHCECQSDEFHCGNKTSCLPLWQRCDGIINCWDGEDEQNCTKLCNENQFACSTGGQCIPLDQFCDGRYKHCDDGSDEPEGCNITCQSGERQCGDGRCLPVDQFCDGVDNCGDNSDESDCPSRQTTTTTRRPPTIATAGEESAEYRRTMAVKKDAPLLTAINNNRSRTSAPSSATKSTASGSTGRLSKMIAS